MKGTQQEGWALREPVGHSDCRRACGRLCREGTENGERVNGFAEQRKEKGGGEKEERRMRGRGEGRKDVRGIMGKGKQR